MQFLASTASDRIINAFGPIIDLLQGIAFPLAFVMAGTGVLLMIINKRMKGLEYIKWAIIGYVLMQMLPSFMSLVRDVAGAMVVK